MNNVRLQKPLNGGSAWAIHLSKQLSKDEIDKFLENLFSKRYFRGQIDIEGFDKEILIPLEIFLRL